MHITIGKWSISRSKALVIIVYGLILLLFISGLYQKLYISADDRIKIHAIPVAISTLYQGHKHDYRGWRSTAMPFQGNADLLEDEFIAKQIRAPVDKKQGHYHWVADDRGYGDYVIAAFALFGPHMKSLYLFWFVILLLSVTLFVLTFGRQVWAMALLALLMLGIQSAVALLKLIHVPVAIYEPRYLEVLALIPLYHLVLTAAILKKDEVKKKLYPLFGQLFIFIFLYHARSSLGWEIVAIVGISLFVLIAGKQWKKICSPLLVIVLLLGSLTLLSGYKHLTYHKSYFQEMGVRTFWHNALMGLGTALPQYSIDDYEIAKLVIQYAREKSCAPSIEKLEAQELLNTLGGHGTADWTAYEVCAKKLYLSLLLQNKWKMLRMYAFDKPLQVLAELSSPKTVLFAGVKSMQSSKNILPWNPFHFIYLIPFSLILFFSAQALHPFRWKLLAITLGIFITAMIPSVAFYSSIETRGGLSASMVIVLYLGMAICLLGSYKWIMKKIQLHRINAYET